MSHTKLLLIRHAHTHDNGGSAEPRLSGVTDVPVSTLGRSEIARLAHHLRASEPPFAAIYSSPLVRARDTAQALVAAGLGALSTVEALREIDCGTYDGAPIAEVQRRIPEAWAANLRQDDELFCWPGGESYRAFRARCLAAVCAIVATHPGERVAVVTHAGVISQILGTLTGASAARWEAHRPGNTAITEIDWQGETGVLVRFDDRTHLREN